LSGSGTDLQTTVSVQSVSQSLLAEMVGTTRSRVNQFMSKFRKQGLIEYDGETLHIKPAILSLLAPDRHTE